MMNQAEIRKRARILVVEDNPADIELLKLALAEAHFDCDLTVIEDGGEALALFKQEGRYAGAALPDMAILDLNLPKYDGLEILEVMRANPDFAELPIAVLSSSSSPREKAKLSQFGVLLHLTKPADLEMYLGIGPALRDFLLKSGIRSQ